MKKQILTAIFIFFAYFSFASSAFALSCVIRPIKVYLMCEADTCNGFKVTYRFPSLGSTCEQLPVVENLSQIEASLIHDHDQAKIAGQLEPGEWKETTIEHCLNLSKEEELKIFIDTCISLDDYSIQIVNSNKDLAQFKEEELALTQTARNQFIIEKTVLVIGIVLLAIVLPISLISFIRKKRSLTPKFKIFLTLSIMGIQSIVAILTFQFSFIPLGGIPQLFITVTIIALIIESFLFHNIANLQVESN